MYHFPLYSSRGRLYNAGMTNEAIKAAIKAKGYTLKAFAEVLGVAYSTLRLVLSGNKPLTEQLRRHILLALASDTPIPEGQRMPAPLALPDEIWQAIDTAAAGQGISSEKYTTALVNRLARDISAGIISSRHK